MTWLSRLTVNEWTVLTALALWMLLGALLAREWNQRFRQSSKPLVAIVGVITVVLCVCLGFAWQEQRSRTIAVVTMPELAVRAGPLDTSRTVLTVHDGAELRVLETKSDWLQVTPDGQRVGWIPRVAAAEIAP